MRTSLNDIKKADDFLTGRLSTGETLLFQAKLWIDPLLHYRVSMLKKVYTLVHLYGRNKMRMELTGLHERIFNDPEKVLWHQQVKSLFPKK